MTVLGFWLLVQLLFVFMIKPTLCVNSADEIRIIIMDKASMFCPLTSVCGLDFANETTERKSCCSECSCSEDCVVYGNCCFPPNGANRPPEGESCFYPRTKVPKPSNAYSFMTYSMVDVCPNETRDGMHNCGDVSVAPWGSMLPVFSKSMNKIFKNKLCAECNGIEDAEEWMSNMACDPYSFDREFSIHDHLSILNSGQLAEHCHVVFNPPMSMKTEELRRHECYITDPPKCSLENFHVPSWSPMSRDQIIKACESYFWSPYLAYGSFQNMFCFVCNNGISTENMNDQSCNERLIEEPKSSLLPKFSVLLDLDVIERFILPQQFIRPRTCEDNQGVCRTVECPLGQLYNSQTRCEYPPVVWYSTSYSLSLRLTLRVPVLQHEFEQGLPENMSPRDIQIASGLSDIWKLRQLYYQLDTNLPKNDSKIISLIVRFSSIFAIHQPQLFFKRLLKSIKLGWSLSISGKAVSTSQVNFLKYDLYPFEGYAIPYWTRLVGEDFTDTIPYENGYTRPLLFDNIFATIIINKLFFCTQVNLQEGEYTEIILERLLYYKKANKYFFKNDYISVINSDGSISVRVCMDDIMHYSENNLSTRLPSGVLISICTLYVIETLIISIFGDVTFH